MTDGPPDTVMMATLGAEGRREPATTSVSIASKNSSVSSASTTPARRQAGRSEEHTSELQSLTNLVCRLLLEKKKKNKQTKLKSTQSNKLDITKYRQQL